VETPPDFLAEPRIGSAGEVDVAAVVWDVLRDLSGQPLAEAELAPFRPPGSASRQQRNQLRLALLACWLLGDEWFHGRKDLGGAARRFVEHAVPALEQYLNVDKLLGDPDRREELVRRLLAELHLRPAGETASQAADRLQTLDSAERQRVLKAAAKAERRAQEIREAMARAAAQDAANRYGE
jgi:hypothetical protein